MNVYTYDGTFDGLLTCIYESYYNNIKPDFIEKDSSYNDSLIDNKLFIQTDEVKASKVYNAIINKISEEALNRAYYTFLSELPDISNLIYKYIRLGFKLGSKLNLFYHNEYVFKTFRIQKKVTFECNRIYGFLRFKLIHDNFYYSSIEPDHNILTLIAPHFCERFKDQSFIIHDVKREYALFYNTIDWIIVPFSKDNYLKMSEINDPMDYQNMWKDYYKNISIKERYNPKLQRRMMPVRYWKHIDEMK